MKVEQRMNRDVVCVDEDEPLSTALQVILWGGHRHLPVLEQGRVVGVLTERDVLRHAARQGWGAGVSGRVKDAMSAPAEVASPGDDLPDAAAQMVASRVGCLPVVKAGRLVGILSRTDLLAELSQDRPPKIARARGGQRRV